MSARRSAFFLALFIAPLLDAGCERTRFYRCTACLKEDPTRCVADTSRWPSEDTARDAIETWFCSQPPGPNERRLCQQWSEEESAWLYHDKPKPPPHFTDTCTSWVEWAIPPLLGWH